MRLLGVLGIGFAAAFGVGWVASFSYQTDWIAALVLSCTIYFATKRRTIHSGLRRSDRNSRF